MLALTAAVAAAGVAAGWTLRAVIFRYAVPAGDPPRRDCPACGSPVARPWPLPAGCAGCGSWLPPRVGAVEAATGALTGILAARIHPWPLLAAACWLALCMIPLAVIDARVRRLPDVLTFPAWAGTVAILVLAAEQEGQWGNLGRALAGGAAALAGFWLVRIVAGRHGPGAGDVKLAASLGTLLAWAGWQELVSGFLAGLLLFAVFGTVLLLAGIVRRDQRLALGPFLISGAFLAFLLAAP